MMSHLQNIDIVVLSSVIGAFVIMLLCLFRFAHRISKLEGALYLNERDLSSLQKKLDIFENRIISLETENENLKGTIQVTDTRLSDENASIESKMIEMSSSVNYRFRDVNKAIRELERQVSKTIGESAKWAVSEPNKGILEGHSEPGENDDSLAKTNVFGYSGVFGYSWVFPTKEESEPIIGRRYLVVGYLEGKEDDLITEEAVWNGTKFITAGVTRFSKVYAYVGMPDSSDVMEHIVNSVLHDKED